MIIKCIGYVSKSKINENDVENIYAEDFANKLLIVYKNNKNIFLASPPDVLIYEYFMRSFPYIKIEEYSNSNIHRYSTLDNNFVKQVCKLIFKESNEDFNVKFLGGGEFPLVIINESKYGYFYNITR